MVSPASDVNTLRSTAAIRENAGATALATLPVGRPDLRNVAVFAPPAITLTDATYYTLGVKDDVIAFRRLDGVGVSAIEYCTGDPRSNANWTALETKSVPCMKAVWDDYPGAVIDGMEACDANTWLLWIGGGTAYLPDGTNPRCWVFRTADGGATWTLVFSGLWGMSSQASQHSVGQHVVFGTYRGQVTTHHYRATVYYSADFGATGFAEIWQDNYTTDLATIQQAHPTATAYNLRHVHQARLDTLNQDYVAVNLDAGSHVTYGPGSAILMLHKPANWTTGPWDVSVVMSESGGVVTGGNQDFSGPQYEFMSAIDGGTFYFDRSPWSRANGWGRPILPPYPSQATVNGGLSNLGVNKGNTLGTVGLYRGVYYAVEGNFFGASDNSTANDQNLILASADGVNFSTLWHGYKIGCWLIYRGALNGVILCDGYDSAATTTPTKTDVTGQIMFPAVTPATLKAINVQPAVTNFLTGPSLTLVDGGGKVHQYLASSNFAAAVPVAGGGYSGGTALKFAWNSNAAIAGYVTLRSTFIAAQGWPADVAAGDRFFFTCWVKLVGFAVNHTFDCQLSGNNCTGYTNFSARQDGEWFRAIATGVCGASYTTEAIYIYLQVSRNSSDAAHSSLPTDGTAYMLMSDPTYVRVKAGVDWRHDWDAVVGTQAADVAEFPLMATAASHHGCLRWQPWNRFDATAAGFTTASEVCATTLLFSVHDTAGGSFAVRWNATNGLIEVYNAAAAATVAATTNPVSLQHLDQVIFVWQNGAAMTLSVFDPYNGWQALTGNTIAAIGTPYRLYSGDGTATNPGLGRYCQPVVADGSVADVQTWAAAAIPATLQGVFDLASHDAATQAAVQAADKTAIEAATLNTDGTNTTIALPNGVTATAGTAAVYDVAYDDGAGDYADTINTIAGTVAEIAARTPDNKPAVDRAGKVSAALDWSADVSNKPVEPDNATLASIAADYQKRGDAVTLPVAPEGYGGSAASEIAAAVLDEAKGDHTGWLTTLAQTDALPSTDEIPAAVWAFARRSLSTDAGGAIGPTAATSVADIYATVFRGGTCPLSARAFLANGLDAKIADIATIKYTIYAASECEPEEWTAIDGHSNASIAPVDVLFDSLQSDAIAADYNFHHVPDVVEHPAFSAPGMYVVEYKLMPVTGQAIIVRFRVRSI